MIEKAKNALPLGSLRAEKPRRVQLHVLVDRKSERIATLTESRMQYRESRRGRSGWLLLPRHLEPVREAAKQNSVKPIKKWPKTIASADAMPKDRSEEGDGVSADPG
jgi:hypothetical protein